MKYILILISLFFFTINLFSQENYIKKEDKSTIQSKDIIIDRWKRPFYKFGHNMLFSQLDPVMTPINLMSVPSTYFLVHSHTDANIQRWSSKQDQTISLLWSAPGLLLGMAVPNNLTNLYVAWFR